MDAFKTVLIAKVMYRCESYIRDTNSQSEMD